MLRAHSLLWYYLWVAPNVILLVLAALAWGRKIHDRFPIFLIYAVVSASWQLILYVADISPTITPETWWRIFWVGSMAEAVLKFAIIGELFGREVGHYSALAKLGRFLISGVGGVLVLVAVVTAAYTPKDNIYRILSGAHILGQTIYLIESGLILFLFLFMSYFRLRWSHIGFGIALGFGISACVQLATWALAANGNFSEHGRVLLDFVKMSTFHVSVLIWSYYLLVPQRINIRPSTPLPSETLTIWNRELERLLHP